VTRPRSISRFAATTAVLAGLALGVASPASALTVGQVRQGAPVDCGDNFDAVQTVVAGNSYTVPSTGGVAAWTVTSWSTKASLPPGGTMTLKFFRKVGEPDRYQVVAHDGPRGISDVGDLRTFAANLQVKAGDILGFHWSVDGNCAFNGTGTDLIRSTTTDLTDGAFADFTEEDSPYRLDISAEVTPSSTFTLGKVKAKANGTAVLKVTVPNPGVLTVSGGGAAKSSSAMAAAKQVPAAGTVKLKIKAKGLKKRKLARNGKVTVKPKITFTPTGGIPASEFRKIKLHRG
jgi:hypothetical protein